jgi:hypothetical protein
VDRTFPTVVVIVVIVLSLVGMYWGWRARQKRQATLSRTASVPDDLGAKLLTLDLYYVATTIAGEPLNRVAVSGLGFRARATVTVASAGLVLGLAGEPDAFIPAQDIVGVQRATWTIDRVVERGGLVCINWMLGDASVDSYFRVVNPPDPTGFIEAVQTITVGATDQEGTL